LVGLLEIRTLNVISLEHTKQKSKLTNSVVVFSFIIIVVTNIQIQVNVVTKGTNKIVLHAFV
jgi:hypothetical protein